MKMKYEKPVVETMAVNVENQLMAGSPGVSTSNNSEVDVPFGGSISNGSADAKEHDGSWSSIWE